LEEGFEKEGGGGGDGIGTCVVSPRFNSGALGVPWSETEEVVERVFGGWDGEWLLLDPV